MEGRTRGSEVKAVGQEAESDRTSLKMEEEGRNGPCCSRLQSGPLLRVTQPPLFSCAQDIPGRSREAMTSEFGMVNFPYRGREW